MNKSKHIKATLILLWISLSSFMGLHKYYVSVTEINYTTEKASLQIVSRLFIDDFETVLQKRYNENFRLDDENLAKQRLDYIQRYYDKKLVISVNGILQKVNLLGVKFEDDMIVSYLEVLDVDSLDSLTVTNKLLFDTEQNQQNITHITVNSKKKSFLFVKGKETHTLKIH